MFFTQDPFFTIDLDMITLGLCIGFSYAICAAIGFLIGFMFAYLMKALIRALRPKKTVA